MLCETFDILFFLCRRSSCAELYATEGRYVYSYLQRDMTCYPYPELGNKALIGTPSIFVSQVARRVQANVQWQPIR